MTTRTVPTIVIRPDGSAAVDLDRAYQTAPADLWTAVSGRDRLARWFAPVEGELGAGGEFVIRFDDEVVAGCRVTACDPPRSFAFDWPTRGAASRVTVEVLPDGETSRLRIRHERLPAEVATGYGAGWHAYAGRLAHELAGDPVPDTWDVDFAAAVSAYT